MSVRELGKEVSRNQIVETLRREGPLCIDELKESDNIMISGQQSVLDRIQELEDQNLIEIEYRRPEKGRGKNYFKLTPKALDPINATLRRLEMYSGIYSISLDFDEAQRYMNEEVAETMVEISKYEYQSLSSGYKKFEPVEISLKTMKELPPSKQTEDKLDEIRFLKAIGFYSIERYYCTDMDAVTTSSEIEKCINENPNLFEEKLHEKIEDAHYFPAIATIQNKERSSELEERFDELDEWSLPLWDSGGLVLHYYEREISPHFHRISTLMENLIKKIRGGEKLE